MTSKHRINYLKLLRKKSKALRDENVLIASTANSGIGPGSGPRSRSNSESSPVTIPVFVSNNGRIDKCESRLTPPVVVSSSDDGSITHINGSQNLLPSSELELKLGSTLELPSVQNDNDNGIEKIAREDCTEEMKSVEELDGIGSGILEFYHDSAQEGEKEKEKERERKLETVVDDSMDVDVGGVAEKEMKEVIRVQGREDEGNNEAESDYDNWRDGEDEDNFDAVVPSFFDLEADVSLPRLQGGFCQISSEGTDSDSNSNINSHSGQSANNKNMKSNKKDPTVETKKRRRGPTKPKVNTKIPIQKQPTIQKTSAQKKKIIPSRNSPNLNLNISGVDADAGVRAEAGDLSGLLVHGLFMSSVLVVDAYLTAKDAAIEKVKKRNKRRTQAIKDEIKADQMFLYLLPCLLVSLIILLTVHLFTNLLTSVIILLDTIQCVR